jgi:DNA-binding MarR family transcriptional regulator
METQEKLDYIKAQDPEGSERLKRLLERKSFLLDRNVYGERFTERQFELVFNPLLRSAYERAQILELLGQKDDTVDSLAGRLSMDKARVFEYLKDLLKKNMVEIAGFDERHPVFKKR